VDISAAFGDDMLTAGDAIADAVGYRVVQVGDGRSEVEWCPGPPWVNMGGGVFGGLVAAMVDVVTGLAVASASEPGTTHLPTVSMHVDYLRPLVVGATYIVRGEALRIGRRLAVADAFFTDAAGTLVVRGTATMTFLRAPSPQTP
jgi:uncharacterized protein (TIGR00369 family)